MASPRKTQWQLWRRFAENLVFTEAPKVVRALQQSPSLHQGLQRGLQLGFDLVVGGPAEPRPQIPAGRPVTDTSVPTAQRARRLSYGPDLTGRAQTGEVVWTWVVYADDPSRGQDRPVLVVGRDRHTLLALMLSGSEQRDDPSNGDPNWVRIDGGGWDLDEQLRWVRIDRVLDVPEESIRRQGAVIDREAFDVVAARLRADYSWR
ncbi:type II toxin-antitoxin system PemK/MazF family toxin [Mycolicibacillus parakoreensis]|uniref:Type II toxin-antitoxin system PemK/MazF family toxin n=1 Tax=Mycolicibacillus parakoreensis TaxID=1069221 RepID=A0ABY3U533_9MYCO|nr:type II toxin-antitoxin system PemK/MazF family toxin [Mycolicibacillus parakoreensis]MCV7314862.1 type II toxin-antitoxin system PemK/MazF family toxin [Mycolicibacillus parakoreensis]ULN53857.1 type II toxin-antitoxin system PemK/MazF family toxin [Mycolicibacillus parakoreensis]